MSDKRSKLTSDEWVHLTAAVAMACDGKHNKLTMEQLNNIIANRYGDTPPDQMEIEEFYDLLIFLYCLNNKTKILFMALDDELMKKILPY